MSRFPPVAGLGGVPQGVPGHRRAEHLATPTPARSRSRWQDYYDTNPATSWNGEAGEPDGHDLPHPGVHRPVVLGHHRHARRSTRRPSPRSTGSTPTARTTGACRPSTQNSFGLTFSPVASFTKASPAVVPSSPVGGALVSGTTPLRWNAQAFAASYTVEVYKNNDQTFSAANRIFTAIGAHHLGGADRPDPGLQPRRTCGGCAGPTPPATWARGRRPRRSSRPARRRACSRPRRRSKIRGTTAYFEWTEVPGAARYVLNLNGAADSKTADRGHRVRRTGAERDRPVQLERHGARRGRQPARDECHPHGQDRLDLTDRQEGEAGPDQADLDHLDQVQREGQGRLEEVGRAGQGPAHGQVQEAQGQDHDRQEEDDGQGQPEGSAAAGNALPGAPQHAEDPRQGGQPARAERRGPRLPPAAPGAGRPDRTHPARPDGTTGCRAPSARLRECVGEPGHGSSLAP